ncbi:MAG: YceI family protein, partial [Flavobacteriales bacterium]
GKLEATSFVIDMNSITCLDIEDAEYNKKLVDHLKNKDFFAVQEFPEASVDITNLQKIDETNYKATAVMVIKGVKGEVEVPLSIVDNNTFKMVMGRLDIDRTKYDITYGSASFFDNLKDKAIDNVFNVKFAIPIK